MVVGHAEAHRRVAHLRVVGHVDEVAAGGELAAAGEAVAVHLRDHRLAELPDAHPALRDVARPVAVTARCVPGELLALVAAAELVAGREALARAAHDHHAHVRILVRLAQRREDRAAQRVVERVALLGAVQRDAPHVRRGIVDENHVLGH